MADETTENNDQSNVTPAETGGGTTRKATNDEVKALTEQYLKDRASDGKGGVDPYKAASMKDIYGDSLGLADWMTENTTAQQKRSGMSFYARLSLLYLLNLIDWICTEVLIGSGKFTEANPIMQPVLNGFGSTLLIKGVLPLVLIVLCGVLFRLTGETENKVANVLITIGIVAYSLGSSADVFILDKDGGICNTRSLGIALSRVKSRIGNAADNVGFNRVFLKEDSARLMSCFDNVYAVDNRIGTSNVNIFKKTKRGCLFLFTVIALETVVIDYDKLPGLYVADKLSSDAVNRAALRSYDIAVIELADTERLEAVRVAHSHKLAG